VHLPCSAALDFEVEVEIQRAMKHIFDEKSGFGSHRISVVFNPEALERSYLFQNRIVLTKKLKRVG
jgi:hypothetical protein